MIFIIGRSFIDLCAAIFTYAEVSLFCHLLECVIDDVVYCEGDPVDTDNPCERWSVAFLQLLLQWLHADYTATLQDSGSS